MFLSLFICIQAVMKFITAHQNMAHAVWFQNKIILKQCRSTPITISTILRVIMKYVYMWRWNMITYMYCNVIEVTRLNIAIKAQTPELGLGCVCTIFDRQWMDIRQRHFNCCNFVACLLHCICPGCSSEIIQLFVLNFRSRQFFIS